MNAIKFTGFFPDGLHLVELCSHDGGGESTHIYIDGYYQGAFHQRGDIRVPFLNDRSQLDAHQLEILSMIIDMESGSDGLIA